MGDQFCHLNKGQVIGHLTSMFHETWADFLEKGKGAQIGEIRTWNNGKKYQKTAQGWVEYRNFSQIKPKHGADSKFKGTLMGPENFGSPQFDADLNMYASTEHQYKDKNGKWSEERVKKVHEPIINSFVSRGKKNPNGVKTVTLMMGAPATGKGYLQKFLRKSGAMEDHIVSIDPDDIKMNALKPDFERFQDVGQVSSAGKVHEEGSDLAKMTFAKMEENGFDYLQDKVFADYGKLMKEINRLDKAGYKVKIVMARVPFEVGYPRMLERGGRTGRYVPEGYMKAQYEQIDSTWRKLMENMPSNVLSAQQYDNSQGEPKLSEEYKAKE